MIVIRQPEEVSRWHLAFHVKQGDWQWEWLIPGRFSHVSAFAYLFAARSWVLIDFTPRRGASVVLWPPEEDECCLPLGLVKWTANCSILTADVRKRDDFRLLWGLTCVNAVKDLIGARSRALSPDGLWRDLVREGAAVVYDLHESARPTAGPGARSTA